MSEVGRPTLTLAAAAGAFGSLDTALNIAFPDLVTGLGIEVADLQWVVVAYVLSSGGALLAAGQLGDSLDHRLLLAAGALVSGLALAACALAPGFGWFLAGRVVQGLGTAMVLAAGPALAVQAAGAAGHGRAIGVFQAAVGAGAAVGPAVGGALVELGGWPAVFWFRVPIAAALVPAGLGLAAAETRRRLRREWGTPGAPPAADAAGAVLLTAGLSAALLAVAGGRSLGLRSPLLWLAIGVSLVAARLYRRRAAGRPPATLVIDLTVFARRSVASAAGLAVLANGAMFVAWLLVPALVVDHLGRSPVAGGLALAASPLAMGLAAPLTGRWTDRHGPRRPVLVGLLVEAAGLAWLVTASPGDGIAVVAAAMGVVGAGLGLFGVANMSEIMAALPPDRQGTAGALALLLRTTGIVAGVAGAAALFDALEGDHGFLGAYRWTTGTGAALALLGAVAAVALGRVSDAGRGPGRAGLRPRPGGA
jgi:MFS family permease